MGSADDETHIGIVPMCGTPPYKLRPQLRPRWGRFFWGKSIGCRPSHEFLGMNSLA
jgi:hypothetical protein